MTSDFKVMVIEPDQKALAETSAVLGSCGVDANCFMDAGAATQAVSADRFDGIFVAARLLEDASSELMQRVRTSSANQQTPIVVMAERDDHQAKQRALQAGGTFFLVKPSDRERFRNVLEVTRLAMVEQQRRTLSVPLATGVACSVNDYCFSTPGVAVSECCIRVRRHQSLVLGATASLSFRLPNGVCIFLTGTVHAHEGMHTALQLHPMSQTDRFRLRQFIRENAAAA
jgi:CheY-like chemotaxis protein